MQDYVERLMADVKAKNPAEPEFHQAVHEVAESVAPVLERHPEYRSARILQRITEPERVIQFRVAWVDDRGVTRVNRAWREGQCTVVTQARGPLAGTRLVRGRESEHLKSAA